MADDKPTPEAPAGYKTTEFWLSLLVVTFTGILVTVLAVQGKLDPTTAVGALASAGVTAAGYSHGRGLAKSGE